MRQQLSTRRDGVERLGARGVGVIHPVQQKLGEVKGRIPHLGLRIDGEPTVPFVGENVSGI